MPFQSFFSGVRRQCGISEDRPGQPRRALNQTQTLHFPLRFPGRIAVLEAGFQMERNMREFEPTDFAGLATFAPDAVVAPLHAALSLADRKLRGLITLPSLRFALVVFTSPGDQPFGNHHRDLLWQAFGVPVFEQLRDARGRVIARECEVHDGLHVAEAKSLRPLTFDLVVEPCECGVDTPRLRARTTAPRAVAAAA